MSLFFVALIWSFIISEHEFQGNPVSLKKQLPISGVNMLEERDCLMSVHWELHACLWLLRHGVNSKLILLKDRTSGTFSSIKPYITEFLLWDVKLMFDSMAFLKWDLGKNSPYKCCGYTLVISTCAVGTVCPCKNQANMLAEIGDETSLPNLKLVAFLTSCSIWAQLLTAEM